MINYIIIILAIVFLGKRLGVLEKKINGNIFFLFTNLSILITCLYYTIILFVQNELLLYFKINLVGYMIIVALIYNFVLVPQARKDKLQHDFYSFYDIIAHIIIPILVLVDWLFLTDNIKVGLENILINLVYPLLYLGLATIKGIKKIGKPFLHSNNYYPYFFLEINTLGKKKFLNNIFFLLLFFVFINGLLLLINCIN